MRERFNSIGKLVLISTVVMAVGSASGCKLFKRMMGKDTIMLDEYNVQSMSVDIRKEMKTVCPLENTQMAVFVTAVDPEEPEPVLNLETWQGDPRGRHNDTLDFANFAFHSELGDFDEHGYFHPRDGVIPSIGREFEFDVVLKKQPDKFSFKVSYKPDYRCVTGSNHDGAEGMPGNGGMTGNSGMSGSSGGEGPGGDGTDGGAGGNGGDGQQGQDGDQIQLWATFVKTPFYERLLAVKGRASSGEYLLLIHPEQSLMFSASGGPGGFGGSGGSGGNGGDGGSGKPGGRSGNGGPGGSGGNGGLGGNGGSIDLIYDSRFPEIQGMIQLVTAAGPGGAGGAPGYGGSAGTVWSGGQQGVSGPNGSGGQSGPPGNPGRSAATAGDVAAQFVGVPGLEPL